MGAPQVDDDALARALGGYAALVARVLDAPEHWLAVGDDDADAGLGRRALHAVDRVALGAVTPSSPQWPQQPLDQRVSWWVDRIGAVAGLAAAAPRVAGALADRVPLQGALGASAAGLAVCAVAREHGTSEPQDWVPLLAQVLFDRRLPQAAPVPSAQVADAELAGGAGATDVGEAGQDHGAHRGAVRTLWHLARSLVSVQHLLDHRPRGGFVARSLAKAPVVGVAGGWLDERGGIRRAARATEVLLSSPAPR